jgi:hypothetical protein
VLGSGPRLPVGNGGRGGEAGRDAGVPARDGVADEAAGRIAGG